MICNLLLRADWLPVLLPACNGGVGVDAHVVLLLLPPVFEFEFDADKDEDDADEPVVGEVGMNKNDGDLGMPDANVGMINGVNDDPRLAFSFSFGVDDDDDDMLRTLPPLPIRPIGRDALGGEFNGAFDDDGATTCEDDLIDVGGGDGSVQSFWCDGDERNNDDVGLPSVRSSMKYAVGK